MCVFLHELFFFKPLFTPFNITKKKILKQNKINNNNNLFPFFFLKQNNLLIKFYRLKYIATSTYNRKLEAY